MAAAVAGLPGLLQDRHPGGCLGDHLVSIAESRRNRWARRWPGTAPRAVGLVHHVRHRSCWTIGDYIYLQDLFVSPEVRGAGIGRRLIEYVYGLARAQGCSRVHWLTHETEHRRHAAVRPVASAPASCSTGGSSTRHSWPGLSRSCGAAATSARASRPPTPCRRGRTPARMPA